MTFGILPPLAAYQGQQFCLLAFTEDILDRRSGTSHITAPVALERPQRKRQHALRDATQRLVTRTVFPTNPPRVDYELTRLGRSLVRLLTPIARPILRSRLNSAVPSVRKATGRVENVTMSAQGLAPAQRP
jgi:HxlR-like helix-turn-helix